MGQEWQGTNATGNVSLIEFNDGGTSMVALLFVFRGDILEGTGARRIRIRRGAGKHRSDIRTGAHREMNPGREETTPLHDPPLSRERGGQR